MTLCPLAIGIGAVLGGVATAWWFMSDKGKGSTTAPLGTPSKLAGHLVPAIAGTSPAPPLLAPTAGLASMDGFSWDYQVGPGDSVGGITEAIVGDDGRYQELLLANPALLTVGEPGVYLGESAWDAAPGALDGQTLAIPLPWGRYIDQLGNPRGGREPFIQDARAPMTLPALPPAPPAASTSGFGPAPYGEMVSMEAAA